MRYTVTKTCHTAQQRFHKGQEIEGHEIISSVPVALWVEAGILAPMNAEAAPPSETSALEEPAAEPEVADDPSSE